MKKQASSFLGLFILVAILLQSPAHAYLDPGQGSIMLQALCAGGAGVAVVIKMYWQQVKTLFIRK